MHSLTRRPVHLLTGAVVASMVASIVAAVLPGAQAAQAASETYPVPSDGVYVLDGHGWGHGHGLNQWGAEAMAKNGKAVGDILDFSYPGTTSTTVADRSLRVLLQADNDNDLEVVPQSGLVFRDVTTGKGATLPTQDSSGNTIQRWRLYPAADGSHLQQMTAGAWHTYNPPTVGLTSYAGDTRFEAPQPLGLILPDGTTKTYRGMLTLHPTGSTTAQVVNTLSMESYLGGVVPSESPASWPAAALQAQAVAARTYATWKADNAPAGQAFDICDSTQCQVYGGVGAEASATNAAIAATQGVIRTLNGKAIFAEFSASNGGWSADGGQPYLTAHADPWDAIDSPHHDWTAQLTVAQLQARFPAVGTLKSMTVTSRDGNGDWGGRVLGVRLDGVAADGSATSVTTTGAGIQAANPGGGGSTIQSSWWTVDPASYHVPVNRVAGRDRIETAIDVSQAAWGAGGASTVVLARSDAFPDALAGGALAAAKHGPVLLTGTSGLDSRVATEIQRILPSGSVVYVLGDAKALSPAIDAALTSAGYQPKRISGPDRYATATAIADEIGTTATPSQVFETNGLDFPDAVSASAAAAHTGGVILLTAGSSQAGPTATWLSAHPSLPRTAVGGAAASADPSAGKVVGANRYDTARLVAQQFFNGPPAAGAASGLAFPDALVAGPALGAAGAPLLLVPPTGTVPSVVTDYLHAQAPTLSKVTVYGGPPTVSDAVMQQLAS